MSNLPMSLSSALAAARRRDLVAAAQANARAPRRRLRRRIGEWFDRVVPASRDAVR